MDCMCRNSDRNGYTPMKLNSTQVRAMEQVREADKTYREAKDKARRAALRQADEAVSFELSARNIAAYLAAEAGVPKRRIGVDALGTSSPNTVIDAVEAGRLIVEGPSA